VETSARELACRTDMALRRSPFGDSSRFPTRYLAWFTRRGTKTNPGGGVAFPAMAETRGGGGGGCCSRGMNATSGAYGKPV